MKSRVVLIVVSMNADNACLIVTQLYVVCVVNSVVASDACVKHRI